MPRRGALVQRKQGKRVAAGAAEHEESFQGIEMSSFLDQLVVLNTSAQVFDVSTADSQMERIRLARMVWDATIEINGEGSLTKSNPAIGQLLSVITANSYRDRGSEQASKTAALRIESILACLARVQSQKKHTLLCTRFSLGAFRAQLPRDLWQMLHTVCPGIVASVNWTDEFIQYAQSFRPTANYEVLPGVGACMFDNYSRKCLYSSTVTTDSSGYKLDMTNSLSMSVPRQCASAQFDAKAIRTCLTA